MKLNLFFVVTAILAGMANSDIIREIWVTTSDCQDCGMGATGKLSVKVCGQGSPSQMYGSCCVAAHLSNNNNNWVEGQTDIFSGPSSLRECYDFDLGTLSQQDDDISMVIYHDGSDGGQFDTVRVFTLGGLLYECGFEGFMDGIGYLTPTSCRNIA